MEKLNVCSGYFDLNIQLEKNYINKTLAVAKQLGYNVVAINTYLEESAFEPKKKKKGEPREVSDVVPPPLVLEDVLADVTKDMKILRRLTVEFSDSLQAHKLTQSDNFKKYDIVAVVPNSQNALQHSCSTLDVDIISFNPINRLPLRFTRKIYTMAVDRGLYFELMYSPAINDSTSRKNIICQSHVYYAVGKSQNVFISSGGASPYDLRGPYDIINLCLILGMNEETAKRAICDGCRSLYIRSAGRRCGKAVVWVSKIPSSDDESSSSFEEEKMDLALSINDRIPSSSSAPKETSNVESPSSNYVELSSSSSALEEKHPKSKCRKRFRTKSPSNTVDCDD